jgi:hypothetical protein
MIELLSIVWNPSLPLRYCELWLSSRQRLRNKRDRARGEAGLHGAETRLVMWTMPDSEESSPCTPCVSRKYRTGHEAVERHTEDETVAFANRWQRRHQLSQRWPTFGSETRCCHS